VIYLLFETSAFQSGRFCSCYGLYCLCLQEFCC